MTTDGEQVKPDIKEVSRRNTEVKLIPGGKRNETEGKLQGLQGKKLEDARRKAKRNQDAWSFGKDRRYG